MNQKKVVIGMLDGLMSQLDKMKQEHTIDETDEVEEVEEDEEEDEEFEKRLTVGQAIEIEKARNQSLYALFDDVKEEIDDKMALFVIKTLKDIVQMHCDSTTKRFTDLLLHLARDNQLKITLS